MRSRNHTFFRTRTASADRTTPDATIAQSRISLADTLLATAVVMALCLTSTVVLAAADDTIGKVKRRSGGAEIARSTERMDAKVGATIVADDRIATDDAGHVGITFRDDSLFAVGPGSEVVIDSFVFDPHADNMKLAAGIARGTFSFLSGQIGKLKPTAVALSTPVATIGIRGTHLAVRMLDGSEGDPSLYPAPLFAPPPTPDRAAESRRRAVFSLLPDRSGTVGSIIINTGSEQVQLSQGRESVTVTEGEPLPETFIMDESEVRRLYGGVVGHEPASPATFMLYFESGTSTLTAESRAELSRILREITDRGAPDISVVGHTDRAGGTGENLRLSRERARVVTDQLVAAGLPGAAIETSSHGESNPLVATADGVAEPRNRRVSVSVR